MLENGPKTAGISTVLANDEAGLTNQATNDADLLAGLAGVWSLLLTIADRVVAAGAPCHFLLTAADQLTASRPSRSTRPSQTPAGSHPRQLDTDFDWNTRWTERASGARTPNASSSTPIATHSTSLQRRAKNPAEARSGALSTTERNGMMGTMAGQGNETAVLMHHVLREARARGVEVATVATKLALGLDVPANLLERLSLPEVYMAWEHVIRALGARFPLTLAAVPFTEASALVVYVTTTYRTSREAFLALERFSPLVTDAVRFELDVAPATARLVMHTRSSRRPGAHAAAEFYLASIAHQVHGATSGRFSVSDTRFAHPGGDQPASVVKALGEVSFGAERNELVFPRAMLDERLDVAQAFWRLIAPAPAAGDPTVGQVRRILHEILAHGGRPTLQSAADALGMTARALQRRLQDTHPFTEIVAEVTRETAVGLLRTRYDLTFKEIAVRLGFSSTRAFTRAFVRWTGHTATSMRAIATMPSGSLGGEPADDEGDDE
jgi:AraC-like DNA-binding protein